MQNEKRLIDALKIAIKCLVGVTQSDWLKGYKDGLEAVLQTIEEAPTVDAVEVVRCRDCRFYNNHAVKDVVFDSDACHWNADEQPDPDDFCSAGERKEQNDE